MSSNLGNTFRNSSRIHGDITCVEGDRKCIFNTNTVTIIEHVTSTMVKSKYLPINGVAMEVGGLISATSNRKMLSEFKMVIPMVIFSPEFAGI